MADKRLQFLILAILAFLLFGGGYYFTYTNQNQGPVIVPSTDRQTENQPAPGQPGPIKVYVGGAVAFPGVYELEAEARAEDAVRKASPLLEADLDALNLAMRLEDEQSIVVPKKQDLGGDQHDDREGYTDSSSLPGVQSELKININTADEQELEQLPGVGSAIAGRIVEYRQQKGPFRTIEDLQNVSGIGEKKFEAVRHLISVN